MKWSLFPVVLWVVTLFGSKPVSPTKQAMILECQDNPGYCKTSDSDPQLTPLPQCQVPLSLVRVPVLTYFYPPRCQLGIIPLDVDPEKYDPYFHSIFLDERHPKLTEAAMDPPRPLFALGSYKEKSELQLMENSPDCTIEKVREQLKMAVQIEFYTLPLYLTSLYSIKKGHNVEAYQLIKKIAMQEMLHFTQAANTLIGIGGRVKIDDPDFVPSYPVTGLPGGVLPKLTLVLKKFDLLHVYNNFMAIESPRRMRVPTGDMDEVYGLNTIGEFYQEIDDCLSALGNDIYPQGAEDMQVKWSWGLGGQLYPVTNYQSAKKGIQEIMEQGEGAPPINPHQSQYAHFYRFEEIVCQRKLTIIGNSYAYSGDQIPYNSEGVHQMRDCPSKENSGPETQCYNVAKEFNRVYRKFLTSLDNSFNGNSSEIKTAVTYMKELGDKARDAMQTNYDNVSTCGPVWDYQFY